MKKSAKLSYMARLATVCFFVISPSMLYSCSFAPEYHRPKIAVPDNYKEEAGNWLPADLKKAEADRGPWWQTYDDKSLNDLEDKVGSSNQDLKAALARYEEARAVSASIWAGYFPTVSADADFSRQKTSKTVSAPRPDPQFNDMLTGVDVSYELDVWGKVRNAVKSGESREKASAADLSAMDLSLHAEMAMDYFALRAQDEMQKVADDTVKVYKKSLDVTKARHSGGAAAEIDVDQAETQLENAKTLAADTELKRAQLEHAIAVLAGEIPSAFTLKRSENNNYKIPPVHPGMPSQLLQQRPDIAASELRMQAANTDIGVARAAYFPDFDLAAEGGFESALASKLFNAPSLFWSIGPSAMLTVFDGGKINALTDQARAAYDESVANYRQVVLTAFQQVEDNLTAIRQLTKENETQQAALAAARRGLKQAQDRYNGGLTTFLDVAVAQNTALQAELNAIDVRTRDLTASVLLVKALGGGWNGVTDGSAEQTEAKEKSKSGE